MSSRTRNTCALYTYIAVYIIYGDNWIIQFTTETDWIEVSAVGRRICIGRLRDLRTYEYNIRIDVRDRYFDHDRERLSKSPPSALSETTFCARVSIALTELFRTTKLENCTVFANCVFCSCVTCNRIFRSIISMAENQHRPSPWWRRSLCSKAASRAIVKGRRCLAFAWNIYELGIFQWITVRLYFIMAQTDFNVFFNRYSSNNKKMIFFRSLFLKWLEAVSLCCVLNLIDF